MDIFIERFQRKVELVLEKLFYLMGNREREITFSYINSCKTESFYDWSTYAPVKCKKLETDKFYRDLQKVINRAGNYHIILSGDLTQYDQYW